MAKFPTQEWLTTLYDKLNTDLNYARVAKNWEADMKVIVEPGGTLTDRVVIYLDLWHGKCRGAEIITTPEMDRKAAFILKAPYDNIKRIFMGKLDPIQAMLTRKIGVEGNMMMMLRNVPTVMDFVRCCREITDSYV